MAHQGHRRDVMHTSNPLYDYSFSWTVDNFHLLYFQAVRGPVFYPVYGYGKAFCFELVFRNETNDNFLDFKMIDTDNCDGDHLSKINVCGKIVIRNMEEKVSDLMTFPYKNIQPTTTLYSFSRWSFKNKKPDGFLPLQPTSFKELGLADGKIILKGTLTFSGWSTKSSIASIPDRKREEVTHDLKTVENCFKSGLSSEIVTFSVDGQVLRAHKAILVARSEVFAKMFQHDMLENKTNAVTIGDVDFCTFNRFLVYLYTGNLELVEDDCSTAIQSLYSVAQKYQVKGLCQICVAHLVKDLSVESVCADLVLADLYGDEEFKEIIKVYLRENIWSVVCTLKWTEIVASRPALAREVMDFVKP